jgi:hypothetical protein
LVANHIGLLKTPAITSLKLHQRHQISIKRKKTPPKTSRWRRSFRITPSKTSGRDVNGGVMGMKIIGADVFGGILTAIGAASENKLRLKHQTMM